MFSKMYSLQNQLQPGDVHGGKPQFRTEGPGSKALIDETAANTNRTDSRFLRQRYLWIYPLLLLSKLISKDEQHHSNWITQLQIEQNVVSKFSEQG